MNKEEKQVIRDEMDSTYLRYTESNDTKERYELICKMIDICKKVGAPYQMFEAGRKIHKMLLDAEENENNNR